MNGKGRLLQLGGVLCLVLTCSGCFLLEGLGVSSGGARARSTAIDDALVQANASGKLLLVDFWGAWCHWCVKMDRTLANSSVSRILNDRFHYLKLDIRRFSRHRNYIREFGVKGIPYIIVLNSDRSVRKVLSGYRPPAAFRQFLQEAAR